MRWVSSVKEEAPHEKCSVAGALSGKPRAASGRIEPREFLRNASRYAGMSVRIVTWNIQKGIGVDLRRDLKRTTRVLSALAPDVVGLQEVLRVDRFDQA